MPKAKDDSLVTIEKSWAQKLKASGFEDIEHSDGRLKKFHSLDYTTEKSANKKAIREQYQKLVDDFTNHKDFKEICKSIAKHGNNKLKAGWIEYVWQLSTQEGYTERRIAENMGRSKTCIHGILVRLRKWMEIL
jgi:hypothetical protein